MNSFLKGYQLLEIASSQSAILCGRIFSEYGGKVTKIASNTLIDRIVKKRSMKDINENIGKYLFIPPSHPQQLIDIINEKSKLFDIILFDRNDKNKFNLRNSPNQILCEFIDEYDGSIASDGENGYAYITGEMDGDATALGLPAIEYCVALQALSSINACLFHNGRNEEKLNYISCNRQLMGVGTLTHLAASYLFNGIEPKRLGSGHSSIVPYQAFPTSDGNYIILGIGSDQQYRQFVQLVNSQSLSQLSPITVTNGDRVRNRELLTHTISSVMKERNLVDWIELFEKMNVHFPYGPVQTIEQLVENDVHFNAMNSWRKVEIVDEAQKSIHSLTSLSSAIDRFDCRKGNISHQIQLTRQIE
ncbi:hypothetical protein SNEBB_001486 [Seison nebaliae]|nr:hypothetical protein SNEBB_001486 [Seison nebaliae]